MMRAIVILESLSAALPAALRDAETRRYKHYLDADTPITIAEFKVPASAAATRASELADVLKATAFYAHLVDPTDMYIAFPRTVVHVRRGDRHGEATAQRVGELFDIPLRQMQFLAMFDADHPDAVSAP
jgi:hypothetical protein